MTYEKNILVTGGAGFIGSHLVRHFVKKYPQYKILNLDNLTYAGNLENLREIEDAENYQFIKGDIANDEFISRLFLEHQFTDVIHLAAESHVDRSIRNPNDFVYTNIVGTVNLLNGARNVWEKMDRQEHLFFHVSTDEVYGSLGDEGYFTEQTPYDPRSPYSASKASSDHLVRAYHHTFNLPVVITNCSNNYGPFQFPEKLIPLMINNIKEKKPLPVYGKGENIRDWLYVGDHVSAIDMAFHKGRNGETYNVGGENEWQNIELVHRLCGIMDRKLGRQEGESAALITFVKDRAGHDFRYAIDCSKLKKELDWSQSVTFEEGLEQTVDWYLAHEDWMQRVTSGAYKEYYRSHYEV